MLQIMVIAMKTTVKILGSCTAAAVLLFMNAVSAQTVTRSDDRIDLHMNARLESALYSYEPIVSHYAGSPSGIFNSGMIFLAEQMNRNISPEGKTRPTVVTSLANLSNLGESSAFGRLVGENLMHELSVRGWPIADVRITRELSINDTGEFILSRDIRKIRDSAPMANVVTGTYTPTSDGVLLSVRVLDVATGRLVSTAQTRFSKDPFISSLVDKPPVLPVVNFTR